MSARLSIDDEAPDFDLSSTEGAVLMLRDEVPRTAVLLYFFGDPESKRVRQDLGVLREQHPSLAKWQVKVLAVSPAKLAQLKDLQAELRLPFPLLRDDRCFAAAYGVDPAAEGEDSEPALYLVNHSQILTWEANPIASVRGAMNEIVETLKRQKSPTTNYPRSVINRLMDFWFNPTSLVNRWTNRSVN